MDEAGGAGYGRQYLDYQLGRGPLRRWVRTFYLRHAARLVVGPTLDFGCGVGELLARLPPGSAGLEVNPEAVAFCRSRGLSVAPYEPGTDRYLLRDVAPGRFQTLVVSHVLEHLPDAGAALRRLAGAVRRLGLRRLVVVVPGRRGFASDPTHRTYVNQALLRAEGLFPPQGLRVVEARYFPLDWGWLGTVFTHHEWTVVFERFTTG